MTNVHTSDAFFNSELEVEIRDRGMTEECIYHKDSDREMHIEKINNKRKEMVYPHFTCTEECKKRGEMKRFTYTIIILHTCIHIVCVCVYLHIRLLLMYIVYIMVTLGCGSLWITDGIWKLTFPHCMYKCKVSIHL